MSNNWDKDQEYVAKLQDKEDNKVQEARKDGCSCRYPTVWGRNAGTPYFETFTEDARAEEDCPVHGRTI